MGRNGIGVTFGSSSDVPNIGPVGRRADGLARAVDEVVVADFMVGEAMARKAKAIDWARQFAEDSVDGEASASSRDMAARSFVSELAAALRIPDTTSRNLIETSRTLVHDLPATLTALAEGRLSYRHAQILVDNSYGLDKLAVKELEARMLPVAERNTAARFSQSVRRTRERLNPETIVARNLAVVEDRSVTFEPARDGMAYVSAFVPAPVAVAIDGYLTDLARTFQVGGETRTLMQLRADIFCDLALGNGVNTAGDGDTLLDRIRNIRPRLLVTIPALTLLRKPPPRLLTAAQGEFEKTGEFEKMGELEQTGELEGYGPIDPQTARDLASGSKSMQRLLTDPVTGVVLKLDHKRYRIPKDLRTWLRVRDGTWAHSRRFRTMRSIVRPCAGERFPGCNRQAGSSEIDHTHDWALGGGTNDDNLAHLCKNHHTLKGNSEWSVRQVGDGVLEWTSPAGFRYQTFPDHNLAIPTPWVPLCEAEDDQDREIYPEDLDPRAA